MNTLPFNLQKALGGGRLVTKAGEPVRNFQLYKGNEKHSGFDYGGFIGDSKSITLFSDEGKFGITGSNPNDLLILDESQLGHTEGEAAVITDHPVFEGKTILMIGRVMLCHVMRIHGDSFDRIDDKEAAANASRLVYAWNNLDKVEERSQFWYNAFKECSNDYTKVMQLAVKQKDQISCLMKQESIPELLAGFPNWLNDSGDKDATMEVNVKNYLDHISSLQ